MSTRCCIVITPAFGTKVVLYHHHDGYPSGVGVQLRKALGIKEGYRKETYFWADRFINSLVKNKAGLNDTEYEVTTGVHTDIEFLYDIKFGHSSVTLLCRSVCPIFDEEEGECVFEKKLVTIPEWDGGRTMYED